LRQNSPHGPEGAYYGQECRQPDLDHPDAYALARAAAAQQRPDGLITHRAPSKPWRAPGTADVVCSAADRQPADTPGQARTLKIKVGVNDSIGANRGWGC